MSDASELTLVKEAILSGVSGCFEWHEKEANRLRQRLSGLGGLTPESIKERTIAFVKSGGEIRQVVETRPEYCHRDYYYKVILPEPGFKDGLFVEMELWDSDPDCPGVLILNAHPQTK